MLSPFPFSILHLLCLEIKKKYVTVDSGNFVSVVWWLVLVLTFCHLGMC
jgi:hypothetical protein